MADDDRGNDAGDPAALRARAERAEEAYEALRYAVSHDLSAPARHVVAFTQLLEQRVADQLEGRDQQIVEHLANAGRRLDRMLDGMIRYVKLLQRPPELQSTDVDEVVQTLVRAREVGHGQDTPPEGTRIRSNSVVKVDVTTDPELLRIIVRELLENAVDYRDPERPNEVTVDVRRDDGVLVIEVADTGTGMEHEYFDRAVKLYGRLVTESEHAGIGLGLTMVKAAVDHLGGTLEHHDVEPHGARFVVRIPDPEA